MITRDGSGGALAAVAIAAGGGMVIFRNWFAHASIAAGVGLTAFMTIVTYGYALLMIWGELGNAFPVQRAFLSLWNALLVQLSIAALIAVLIKKYSHRAGVSIYV